MANQNTDFGQVALDLQRASSAFAGMTSAASALGSALNEFRKFERQLVLTNAIAQGTVREFERMKQAAVDFSLVTTTSAVEAGVALQNLAQAGFTAQESLNSMTGVLLLAQATLADVAMSADVLTATIRAFQLTTLDTTRVANTFTAAITGSLATIDKLAFAMRQVAPVANLAGLSIEETTAQLAVLFNQGLRGEQAGTALRNVIIRLVRPLGEAADILREAGVATRTATGELRKLDDILRDISDAGITDAQLARIFETEALAGVKSLILALEDVDEAGKSAYERLRDEITDTDRAIEVAAENLQTFDASLRIFQNNVVDLAKDIGEELAPLVVDLTLFVQGLIESFRNLNPETRELVLTIGGLGLGVAGLLASINALALLFGGPALAAVKALVGALGSLIIGLGNMATASIAGTGALTGLATAARGAAASVGAFFATFGPGLAVLGVGAGVIAGVAKAFDAFTTSTSELNDKLKAVDLDITADVRNDASEVADRILGDGLAAEVAKRITNIRRQFKTLDLTASPLDAQQFANRAQARIEASGNEVIAQLSKLKEQDEEIFDALRARAVGQQLRAEALEDAGRVDKISNAIREFFGFGARGTINEIVGTALDDLTTEQRALVAEIEEVAGQQFENIDDLRELLEQAKQKEREGIKEFIQSLGEEGNQSGFVLAELEKILEGTDIFNNRELINQVTEDLANRDETVSAEDIITAAAEAAGVDAQVIKDALKRAEAVRRDLLLEGVRELNDELQGQIDEIGTELLQLELDRADSLSEKIRLTREIGTRQLEANLAELSEDITKDVAEKITDFNITTFEGVRAELADTLRQAGFGDLVNEAGVPEDFAKVISGEALTDEFNELVDENTSPEEAQRIAQRLSAKYRNVFEIYLQQLKESGQVPAEVLEELRQIWRNSTELTQKQITLGITEAEIEEAEIRKKAREAARKAAEKARSEFEKAQRERDKIIRERDQKIDDELQAARDIVARSREINDLLLEAEQAIADGQRTLLESVPGVSNRQRIDIGFALDVTEIERDYNQQIQDIQRKIEDVVREAAEEGEGITPELQAVIGRYEEMIDVIELAKQAEIDAASSFEAQMERRSNALDLFIRDLKTVGLEADDTLTKVGAGVAAAFAEYQKELVTLVDITQNAVTGFLDATTEGIADFIFENENAWENFKKSMLRISREIFEGFTRAFLQQGISSLTGGEGSIFGNAQQPSQFGSEGTPGIGQGGILGRLFPGLSQAFGGQGNEAANPIQQALQEAGASTDQIYQTHLTSTEAIFTRFEQGIGAAMQQLVASVQSIAADVRGDFSGSIDDASRKVASAGDKLTVAMTEDLFPNLPNLAGGLAGGSLGRGRANEGELLNALVGRGLSPAQARGVVANFQAESGLDAGINERNPLVPGSRGGFGLYQLTGPRRRQFETFAQERGVALDSIDAQLDFMFKEFGSTESRAFDLLRQARSSTEAARVFSEEFLRPGIPHMDNRLENARRLENQFPDEALMAGVGADQLQRGSEKLVDASTKLSDASGGLQDGARALTGIGFPGQGGAFGQPGQGVDRFGNPIQQGQNLAAMVPGQQQGGGNPLAALGIGGGQGGGGQMMQIFQQAALQMQQIFTQFTTQLQTTVTQFGTQFQAALQQAVASVQAAAAGGSAAAGAGGGKELAFFKAAGLAEGGKIRGPGTGTSDDIMAWLSNGEYVTTAKATQQYQPALEAMNSGASPSEVAAMLVRMERGMQRFAEGGMAARSAFPSITDTFAPLERQPAFANGGLVSSPNYNNIRQGDTITIRPTYVINGSEGKPDKFRRSARQHAKRLYGQLQQAQRNV